MKLQMRPHENYAVTARRDAKTAPIKDSDYIKRGY